MLTWLTLVLVAANPEVPPAPPELLPPPTRFQTQIDDPMLVPLPPAEQRVGTWQEALELARQRSTDLLSAQAAVLRAEGRWRQALSLLLPNARLTATGAYDLLNPDAPAFGGVGGPTAAVAAAAANGGKSPTVPTGTATASLSQSLVDLGAWRGLASASAAEDSAEASLRDVRRRVVQGLARSLVAVVAAERAAELNRVGLGQALERAALTERTQQLGAATQLDVVRVQQDVALARSALIAGDEQLRRTREALGLALGFDRDIGVVESFRIEGLIEGARATCEPLKLLSERPDLVAAEKNVESAQQSRRQASAGYLPTLGLTSSLFGYTTEPGLGRLATWNVAAVLSVPIWEGGGRAGLVRERAGAVAQAAQALESTRRQAQLELARARRSTAVAEALTRTAAHARSLAERLDQLTRRSFEVGRASSLELVQSAAALRQAELTLTLREFEWVQARLDAYLTEATCNW